MTPNKLITLIYICICRKASKMFIYITSIALSAAKTVMQAMAATTTRPRPKRDAITAVTRASTPEIMLSVA